MEKKKIIEILDLQLIKDNERPIKLVKTWRALAIDQVKILEDISVFLKWYYGSDEEQCPYSAVTLKNIANQILIYYSGSDDEFIERHRRDYDVLEIVCKGKHIISTYIVELVKIMDYIADNDLV